MSLDVSSPAFEDGETIPEKHTCEGEDVSPPLRWGPLPDGTRSVAVIADDPDAPAGTWVHWVLYGVSPEREGLPEGVPAEGRVLDGAAQGRNDFDRTGYGGPCPPPNGAHRYFFKVYALDGELDLEPGATKEQLLAAMEGHILAEGRLVGRCRRRR